jgi:ferric-dicitrate binding protein FerR (iron transport regulator)
MELENRILEILMKEVTCELTLEEDILLASFAAENASNKSFLDENRAVLNALPSFAGDDTTIFDVDLALTKVKSRIEESTTKIRTLNPRTKKSPFSIQKFAAVGILLIGLGGLLYSLLGSADHQTTFAATDQVKNITLPDGSDVVLNKNSSLTLLDDYGTELRKMRLDGEAFFKVKNNENQPFIVKSGDLEVEVLGTQFNIDAQNSEGNSTVFVHEGKVKVTSLKSRTKVLLTAGESSIFENTTSTLRKDKVNQYNATSWLDDKLRFENTELSQVIRDIEDHYAISVILNNNELTNCTYTSIFNGATADEVLETLSAVFELQLMKEGDSTFKLTGGSGNCN